MPTAWGKQVWLSHFNGPHGLGLLQTVIILPILNTHATKIFVDYLFGLARAYQTIILEAAAFYCLFWCLIRAVIKAVTYYLRRKSLWAPR